MTQKLDDEPVPEKSPSPQSTKELLPEYPDDSFPPAQEDNPKIIGVQDTTDSYPTTRPGTKAKEPSRPVPSQPGEDVSLPSGEPGNW